MSDIAQDVCGSKTEVFLASYVIQQLGTGRCEDRVKTEMINERVGIHKNGYVLRDVGKRHYKSSMESRAIRSINSGSLPAMSPAVAQTRSTAVWISHGVCKVTRTWSCSLRGKGWVGLSTPFS